VVEKLRFLGPVGLVIVNPIHSKDFQKDERKIVHIRAFFSLSPFCFCASPGGRERTGIGIGDYTGQGRVPFKRHHMGLRARLFLTAQGRAWTSH